MMARLTLAGLLAALLPLVATFIFAGITAGFGAYQIKQNANVSHLWEGRQRASVLAGFCVIAYALLLAARGGPWWNGLAVMPAFLACCCLFGLRFDIRLNLRRLLPRYYLGTDPQTAATDKRIQARGLTGKRFAALKLAGVLAFTAAALLLSGCRTGRDVATPHGTTAANIAQAPGIIAQPASNATQLRGNAAGYVAITPPAPNAPAWQHRQYRRNVRAQPRTVPLLQGRAAVNAPLASQVLASYKPKGPVVQADSGATVQVAVAAKNAQAAAGEGIQQQRVEPTKPTIWQRLTSLVGGLTSTLSWLLLGAVLLHAIGPGVGYGSGWLRRFVSKRSA